MLLVLAAGYFLAGDFFVTARDFVALRAERTSLVAEIEQLRTELAVEAATRRELERQAAELNTQVAELNGQIEFLRARRAPDNGAN